MPIHPVFWKIESGNAGIMQTVEMIRTLSQTASADVSRQARRILADSETVHATPLAQAHAIYTWVQRHMIYTPDDDGTIQTPHGVDYVDDELTAPDILLRDIDADGFARGDCDDYVLFMSALLRAVNLPHAYVLVSSKASGVFDHIYIALPDGTALDAITDAPFGWSVDMRYVTNSAVIPA